MGKHKKTRKEKIISGLKRKLAVSVPQASSTPPPLSYSSLSFPKDIPLPVSVKKLKDKEKNNNFPLIEPSFIFKSLKRVALFTILAIGSEIVLYWWLELGGEKILAKIKL